MHRACRQHECAVALEWTAISNLWESSSQDASNGKQLTYGEQEITDVFPLDGKLAMANRADNGVWVMDLDGAYRKLAADARGGSWFVGCGRFIVFTSDRSGVQELVRIDEDGANPKVLATGFIWGESCSPDAKFVYYPELLRPRWKIKRIPIDGGAPVEIAENPGEAMPGRVAISPDGTLLAFPYDVASSEPTLKIGVVSIAGGPLLKDFNAPNSIAGVRWAPDGHSLQYLWDTNGATNLWEQPVTGGPPHQLTKFTSGRIFDFNWSADGKQLLLARGEVTSDVVLLNNLR
jgi:Tol biopolymer transport system component